MCLLNLAADNRGLCVGRRSIFNGARLLRELFLRRRHVAASPFGDLATLARVPPRAQINITLSAKRRI
jgi:hypothetical protein